MEGMGHVRTSQGKMKKSPAVAWTIFLTRVAFLAILLSSVMASAIEMLAFLFLEIRNGHLDDFGFLGRGMAMIFLNLLFCLAYRLDRRFYGELRPPTGQ